MLPATEIDRRLPVWHALSDLFLDTELQPNDYRWIADILQTSGNDRAKLRSIFEDEVAPAFVFNMLDVAGEWCGWSADQVREIMLRSLHSGGGAPPVPRLKLRLFRHHVADEWSKIEPLLGAS